MKVIAILGSPRGEASQTLRLAKAFGAGVVEAGGEVEFVDVCRLKIEYCRACDVCHRTDHCVFKDDFEPLRGKLLQADGIMISSPDYFRTVSAPVKAAIDRMSNIIHCQRLAGKYACSLATSGGPAGEEVTTYLNDILLSMGATVVGGVAAFTGRGETAVVEAEAKARTLGHDLAKAIASRRVYPEQEERHRQTAAYFRRLVEINQDRWPHEHALWARFK